MVDVCPYCLSVTEYCPNPYYYHKCKKCEKDTSMSQLLRGIRVNEANDAIKELSNEIEYIKNISYLDCT